MATDPSRLTAYSEAIAGDSAESRFLRRIPWVLDAGQQPVDWLIRSLRMEAERFAEFPRPARFSLLTPMWKTPPRLLDELVLSVRCQSYQDWELLLVDDASPVRDHIETARAWAARDPRIRLFELDQNRGISGARNHAIEHATGDYLAVLDHDDLLHPSALGVFARHIQTDPEVNFLFSNECKITEDSTELAHYLTKPPFDRFTLLRNNYICHFTAIRRDLLDAAAVDGRWFRGEYDGCEDHDLFLRIALSGAVRPQHVPMFLYYWRMIPGSTSMVFRSKPEIPRRRERMLEELVPRFYPGMSWVATPPGEPPANTAPSVRLTAQEDGPSRPSLLVVVPFKDNVDLTLRCLDSLETQEGTPAMTVVLVDNRSREAATRDRLAAWLGQARRHDYRLMPHDGAFNFNRMNNLAVRQHGGGADLLLFLNNDVELVSPDAIRTLALHLIAEPECGFAGLRLMYPDERGIQHGGVNFAPEIFGSGYFTLQHGEGNEDFVWDEKVCFAVTFACAMTRRSTFEALGGLDEIRFPNSFGDVDLCARAVETGYRNHYFGTVWGWHHESKSRGRYAEDLDFANLYERHGATFARHRLRDFRLTPDYVWRLTATGPKDTAYARAGSGRPMRYVVADRVCGLLKRSLGPFYPGARRLASAAIARARSLRNRRRPRPAPSIYRPRLADGSRAGADRHEGAGNRI